MTQITDKLLLDIKEYYKINRKFPRKLTITADDLLDLFFEFLESGVAIPDETLYKVWKPGELAGKIYGIDLFIADTNEVNR